MALTKFFTPQTVNTDALFRELIQNFHAGVLAAGMVQTADTGQINPVTVNFPAVNSTYAGYLIYKFNDTLQATKPVFWKVIFGRNSNNTYIAFSSLVGTGSDGAGNLTGILGTTHASTTLTNGSITAPMPSFVAGDAGAGGTGWITFAFRVGDGTTAYQHALFGSISRTRNADGVANNQGLNVCMCLGGSFNQRFFDFALNQVLPSASPHNQFAAVTPHQSNPSYVFNGETPVFPVQPSRPYLDYPDLGLVMFANVDVSQGQLFQTELAGAIRKYWAVYYNGNIQITTNGGTYFAVGVRVE